MTIEKEATYHDMPIEKEFGYAQAIKVGDTIYLPEFGHQIDSEQPNSPYWKIRATNFV